MTATPPITDDADLVAALRAIAATEPLTDGLCVYCPQWAGQHHGDCPWRAITLAVAAAGGTQ